MNIYYDEEGDFLEVSFANSKKGHFKNLGNGTFHRVDEEGNILGVAISDFRSKAKEEPITVDLPSQ